MDRSRARPAVVAEALLAGGAGTAGSFAFAGSTSGFVAAPIADLLARRLPGAVLTAVILVLGDLGRWLALASAVTLAVIGLGLVGGLATATARRVGRPRIGGPLAAVLAGVGVLAATGAPGSAVGAAVGVGLVAGVGRLEATPSTDPAGRRGTLRVLAWSAAVVGLGGWAGASGLGPRLTAGETGIPGETDRSAARLLDEAESKSLDVAGLEPLVSDDFYEVDINVVNPELRADAWSLSFTGRLAEPTTIDYATLTGMPARHRFNTLRCVGETLNGLKMDTALWTGVPMAAVLADLAVDSDCSCVMLGAADDYYEEFPLAALERGFLAWGMNGGPLPRRHGHPVRALIPGHWGEINVKWLTEIEFLDREVEGFWERRGWHGTGPVKTVAKFRAEEHLADGRIRIAGHAYAGTRGIDRVEVSFDDGETWKVATLSEPLPGDDVWRQWVYEYETPGASHLVTVRAVDGTGAVQPREYHPPFPDGPEGWVVRRVDG